VLEALNNSAYDAVPQLMQGWAKGQPDTGFGSTVANDVVGRRQWEANIFQTPDEMSIDVTTPQMVQGEASFGQIAQTLNIQRQQFVQVKKTTG
jgi:hypothetical protein